MSEALAKYRKDRKLTLAALAELFTIQAPALYKWETGRVPAERVIEVERLTGIPRHDLRPDIYPRETAGQAA